VRRRVAGLAAALAALGAVAPARAQAPQPPPKHSRAIGLPWDGRLEHGVLLPDAGFGFLSYDDVLDRLPDRRWRRWGTQELVELLERVCAAYIAAHPTAQPVLIGDLSRRHGGPFGKRYGGLGHASHQNGLDADVYYPRGDRRLKAAWKPLLVDRRLAQDLVDRFVAAGAQRVFVGLHLGLKGPRRVVQALADHDDHLHVRIPNPGSASPSSRPAK
jgi:murein endopeptidase